jgi:hypothetical protein
MSTLFMHYRPRTSNGEINDPRGGATVAITENGQGEAVFSIAFCSMNDVFNRSIGRAVSEGRLMAKLKAGLDDEVHGFFGSVTMGQDSKGIKDAVHQHVKSAMDAVGYR